MARPSQLEGAAAGVLDAGCRRRGLTARRSCRPLALSGVTLPLSVVPGPRAGGQPGASSRGKVARSSRPAEEGRGSVPAGRVVDQGKPTPAAGRRRPATAAGQRQARHPATSRGHGRVRRPGPVPSRLPHGPVRCQIGPERDCDRAGHGAKGNPLRNDVAPGDDDRWNPRRSSGGDWSTSRAACRESRSACVP
jgi:hypothetical protein